MSTHVVLIHREAVIDALGQNDQIPFEHLDAHPFGLARLSDVEVAASVRDVADLVIVVNVLYVVEGIRCFVGSAHRGRRVCDLVLVGKSLGLGQGI